MLSSIPKILPQTLAVKLTVAGERSVRQGHPWVFSESIEKCNKEGRPGDIAIVFSHKTNKVMGIGLYDPQSPIRIKMLHWGSSVTLNEAFFTEKIARAFSLRNELLQTHTNAYRLLFGENDGFPSLIADVYGTVLVLKLYSAIWLPYLSLVIPSLLAISQCETAVLRLGRNVEKELKEFPLRDGKVLVGNLDNETLPFMEHGVHFSANVIKGHKTGYFLDHRHNRKRAGELAVGKTMLDVFAYAGGFSVHALARGAKEVTSVDISEQALELAHENGKLNHYTGIHTTLAGDAFEVLRELIQQKRTFEVVVIDPPSFAKSAKEITLAQKKYAQLAQLGAQLTARKGLLVLASCSSRITADVFFGINEEALRASGRKFRLVEKTFHDSDHPIGFPEGAYLKCGYYRLDP
ncbi:MAG: class I SAM-dependent rRNA methyltransferase [Flavobacteriaceae bacterium]